MHPAESKVGNRFAKWQYVKRFGATDDSLLWASEYLSLIEDGKAKYVNATMPFDVWASLAASLGDDVKKTTELVGYLSHKAKEETSLF